MVKRVWGQDVTQLQTGVSSLPGGVFPLAVLLRPHLVRDDAGVVEVLDVPRAAPRHRQVGAVPASGARDVRRARIRHDGRRAVGHRVAHQADDGGHVDRCVLVDAVQPGGVGAAEVGRHLAAADDRRPLAGRQVGDTAQVGRGVRVRPRPTLVRVRPRAVPEPHARQAGERAVRGVARGGHGEGEQLEEGRARGQEEGEGEQGAVHADRDVRRPQRRRHLGDAVRLQRDARHAQPQPRRHGDAQLRLVRHQPVGLARQHHRSAGVAARWCRERQSPGQVRCEVADVTSAGDAVRQRALRPLETIVVPGRLARQAHVGVREADGLRRAVQEQRRDGREQLVQVVERPLAPAVGEHQLDRVGGAGGRAGCDAAQRVVQRKQVVVDHVHQVVRVEASEDDGRRRQQPRAAQDVGRRRRRQRVVAEVVRAVVSDG